MIMQCALMAAVLYIPGWHRCGRGEDEALQSVRAAFALLQGRASAKIWNAAWAKATKAAALAFAADKAKTAKTIAVTGGLNTNEAIKTSEVR